MHFECNRDGFAPDPVDHIQCVYDTIGNQPMWDGVVPVCRGKVKFQRCSRRIENCFNEAFKISPHNLCLKHKKEKYHNFSSEQMKDCISMLT